MLALVTGGHGFVGSHLCEALVARGLDVRVLARPGSDLRSLAGLPVEVVRGDVTDPESLIPAVADAGWVFHLAAALKGLRPDDLFRVNEAGTRNLAQASLRHSRRLSRLVFVSSLAAAGPSPGGRVPVTESTPERPLTWYGESKLGAERALRALGTLPSVIARPPMVYGPREKDIYGYFRLARRGVLPVLGFRERFYSLVYVGDLVEGLVRLAEASVPNGEVYHLAGDEVVSWSDLAGRIGAAVGVRGIRVRVPEAVAVVAGRVADAVARARRSPAIFSSQKVLEMRAPGFVCSPEKAARDLGWRAATPLVEGLSRTARWYREHGWL